MKPEIVVRDLEIVLDYLNEVGAWSHADVVARLESVIKDAAKRATADEADMLDRHQHDWNADPCGCVWCTS